MDTAVIDPTNQTTETATETDGPKRGKPAAPEFNLEVATDEQENPISLETVEATEKRPERKVLTAVPFNWDTSYKVLTAAQFASEPAGLWDRYQARVCELKIADLQSKRNQHLKDAENANNPAYQKQQAAGRKIDQAMEILASLTADGSEIDPDLVARVAAMQEKLNS